MDKYILVDGVPVRVDNMLEWAKWFESAGDERIVRQDRAGKLNEILVSTAFLGIDHRFANAHLPEGGKLPPLLFETMIFNGGHDGYQARCSTREEALVQHQHALDLACGRLSEND